MKDSSENNQFRAERDLQNGADGQDGAANLQVWDFRLYVAGQSPKSIAAFDNLKRLCEQHLFGRYRIQIIDVIRDPSRARENQIVVIPSVVRMFPGPVRKVIGALSDTERVMIALELHSEDGDS